VKLRMVYLKFESNSNFEFVTKKIHFIEAKKIENANE